MRLRGLQRQAKIIHDNIETQRQTLRIIKDRQRVGLATDLDVAQQTAQLGASEALRPPLDSQIRAAIHALGILLGDDPDALSEELTPAGPLPPTPPMAPVGLPSELLRRRPDIRRAERQLAAATARIGAQMADLYPRFSVTGQVGLDSTKAKNLLDWSSRYFIISPGVAWPIFDAGQIRDQIAIQNELTRQAELTYRQTILQALGEVEDAIANYQQEQLRRAALNDSVNAGKDAVRLARDQYRRGVTDFLTVLDAQRSLLDSENSLAQSDINIATDLVALYKALGGGWEPDAPPPARLAMSDGADVTK
jgi:NodT family efflux transporter outer membrane factor (OMF) lipoprotein